MGNQSNKGGMVGAQLACSLPSLPSICPTSLLPLFPIDPNRAPGVRKGVANILTAATRGHNFQDSPPHLVCEGHPAKVEFCQPPKLFGPHLTFTECHWGRLRGLTVLRPGRAGGRASWWCRGGALEAEEGRGRAGPSLPQVALSLSLSVALHFRGLHVKTRPICCARLILYRWRSFYMTGI